MPGLLFEPGRDLRFLQGLARHHLPLCFKSLEKLLSLIYFFRNKHQAGAGTGARKIGQERLLLDGGEGVQPFDDQEPPFREYRERLGNLNDLLGGGLITIEDLKIKIFGFSRDDATGDGAKRFLYQKLFLAVEEVERPDIPAFEFSDDVLRSQRDGNPSRIWLTRFSAKTLAASAIARSSASRVRAMSARAGFSGS